MATAAKTKQQTKLMVVRKGFYLQWPKSLGGNKCGRGGPGYVVDMTAPFEKDWCKGVMHMLEPAPKGATVDSIDVCPGARNLRRKALAEAKKPAPKKKVDAARKEREGEGEGVTADGLMMPGAGS